MRLTVAIEPREENLPLVKFFAFSSRGQLFKIMVFCSFRQFSEPTTSVYRIFSDFFILPIKNR